MAALVASQDLVVELDYGQFYLHTADNDPELPVALLERAQDGDGIAQDSGLVVVESPHQNNFEMPLRVEVWDSAPPDDLDGWDEAFQVRLDVAESGLVYESPTTDFVDLAVPPGAYHALITGRGFVASGWPGSTEPGDNWRIRLWPTATAVEAKRLKRWIDPDAARFTAPLMHEAAGQVAGAAVGFAVQHGAEGLSGELGGIELDYVFPAPRRRLFENFAHWQGWMGCMGGTQELAVGAYQGTQCNTPEEDPDHAWMGGKRTEVRSTWTDFRSPRHVEMTWNWYAPPSPDRGGFFDKQPVLPVDSRLRFDLTEQKDDDETTRTTVHLSHHDLPVEWLEDMTNFWLWQLERADKRYHLGRTP